MSKDLEHLKLLGLKVRERVTKLTGVVTSVSFDLFGCVQACIDIGVDETGKRKESYWWDINRLEIVSKKPVMQQPAFATFTKADHGPAEKPSK